MNEAILGIIEAAVFQWYKCVEWENIRHLRLVGPLDIL